MNIWSTKQNPPSLTYALDEGVFAIYARFSTHMQKESSIEDQIRSSRQYGESLGLKFDENLVFSDRAISGQTDKRPGLDRLMSLIRDGKARFRTVIMADTSRLTRNMTDSSRLRDFFEFHQIKLHFAENRMSSENPGFDMQHAMTGIFDHHFVKQLGEKIRRGHTGRVLNGYNPSGSCYGYKNVPDEDPTRVGLYNRPFVKGVHQVVDPAQASVVRRIFEMYRDGMGYHSIATALNREGVQSPGKPWKDTARGWCDATVSQMLRNRKYIGEVIFGKTRNVLNPETRKKRARRQPESTWAHYENQALRIVPDELWHAVHQRLEKFEGTDFRHKGGLARTAASRSYCLSGLLVCGACTANMVLWGGPNGAYCCSSNRRGIGCSNRLKVKRLCAEQQVLHYIATTLIASTHFSEYKAKFIAAVKQAHTDENRRRREIEGRRDSLIDEKRKIAQRLRNLTEAVAGGSGSKTIMDAINEDERQLEFVEQQLETKACETQPLSDQDIDRFLQNDLANLSQVLLNDPERTKQELQRRISKLVLMPIVQDSVPVYQVQGDLRLIGRDAVLLTSSLSRSSEQHHQDEVRLSLNGLTLVTTVRSRKCAQTLVDLVSRTRGLQTLPENNEGIAA